MFSRKADGPLTVQVPAPAEDHPRWRRVGVITAIGFVVGVFWPRLAGVRLGPSVPESSSAVASAAPPATPESVATGATAPSTASPSGTVAAAVVTPAPSASAAPTVNVTIGHGVVYACKTSDGDSAHGADCGTLPGLDGLVMPRLHKLTECPEAVGANGKVHFTVHLDFARGGIGVDLGKGHGVSSTDALLACAKADMTGASISNIPHDNPKYSVAYSVAFSGGAAAGATASAAPSSPARTGGEPAAEGSAQVMWEVAIVRDAPKSGKVIARLQRGAELHLGAPKDGWYPVKFGDGFGSDGWVYRGAIGR
jgi:Bacterial SH3 domain